MPELDRVDEAEARHAVEARKEVEPERPPVEQRHRLRERQPAPERFHHPDADSLVAEEEVAEAEHERRHARRLVHL
jgi:hypothetical protein